MMISVKVYFSFSFCSDINLEVAVVKAGKIRGLKQLFNPLPPPQKKKNKKRKKKKKEKNKKKKNNYCIAHKKNHIKKNNDNFQLEAALQEIQAQK